MPCGNDFLPSLCDISSTEKKIWRNEKNIKPPLVSCCWYSFFWQRWQMIKKNISQLWGAGMHEFSRNFEAISKFYAPYGSYQPRSKLRGHKYQGEQFHSCEELGCTNFPKILKPSQNSTHHTGHINHVPNWGPTNTKGNNFTTVISWAARIFQKFWSHLKILGTIRVISTTFETEGPQTPRGATV